MSGDLEGKTILVTGANTGIGRETALALARRGAAMVLAGRSEERTGPVVDEIIEAGGAAEFVALDLGDLDSVRRCAEELLARERALHVLINNAGLARSKGVTAQGFERTFGVNHLGHFLLTELLLDRLKESAPARVVIVASKGHYRADGIDWDALTQPTRTFSGFPEYAVSKLCNVLHAKELAERLGGSGVTTYSLHPGVVASDVWRNVPWPFNHLVKIGMISEEEGARTSIWCATAPELADQSGRYYDACREKEPSRLARDPELAKELRRRSLEWITPYLG